MLSRRHAGFAQISPRVGEIDQQALAELMRRDPEAAAALLTDLAMAVDYRLRDLARRLAAHSLVRIAAGAGREREPRRIAPNDYEAGGDVDLERTLDRSGGTKPKTLEEVVVRAWSNDRGRVVLLIDRSGSMSGGAVARAAVAAASVSLAAPPRLDCGVIAFARDRLVLKPLGVSVKPTVLVDQILSLRGHGVTDLAGALHDASKLLAGGRATRRTVVLLSDCVATEGADPTTALRGIDKLHVILPGEDPDSLAAARRLAGPSGGRVTVAATLQAVATAISRTLGS